MSADPGSRARLEELGFEGFRPVGQLHAGQCVEVPNERGVYAVFRDHTPEPPAFLPRSTAPEWRGQDPSRPIEELTERWVPGAEILFVGVARGPGVRSRLKQRVKRFLRFGHGKVVGHWGGRFVWQLRDHAALRVAWKATGDADPLDLADELRAAFRERYGVLPFADAEPARTAEADAEE